MKKTIILFFLILLILGCQKDKNTILTPSINTITAYPESNADLNSASEYMIKERLIPNIYKEAYDFLEMIKMPKYPDSPLDIKNTPFWETDDLLNYISKDGVKFINQNFNIDSVISKSEIKKQLDERSGVAFEQLSYLSYIYSIPYKQYSDLRFFEISNSLHIRMWSNFELIFVKEDEHYKLKTCDYLQIYDY